MEGKSKTNYGATVGFMGTRESILNPKYVSKDGFKARDLILGHQSHITSKWSIDLATDKQIDEILEACAKSLREGALGVGLHGRYSSQVPPQSGLFGTSEALAAVAKHRGALIVQDMTAQCLNLFGACR